MAFSWAWRRFPPLRIALITGFLLLAGCATPPSAQRQADAPAPARTSPPKVLRMAALREMAAANRL